MSTSNESFGRDLIFISHATPEDNDFASWISARLTAIGYNAWVELNELAIGDRFWPDIELAIRERAVKFITVVSRNSVQKRGYRRELSMADALERSNPGFILPVRIDEMPLTDVPAEIHDKHILDFSDGWHRGLAALVKRLEKDEVPRNAASSVAASNWAVALIEEYQKPIEQEETLLSNWLHLKSAPAAIRFHQFQGAPISEAAFKSEWPSRLVGNTVITFAKPADFSFRKHFPGTVASVEILLDSFLAPSCQQFPMLSPRDRRNILVDLYRQAWEKYVAAKGLLPYALANRRAYWYMPWSVSPGKQLPFVDATGKKGKRALTGESVKLGVRWHFAVTPNVVFSPEPRVGLGYTVIFTKDGEVPLEDKVKAHRFRRSFCKNWWQDRWRDMLSAYSDFLTGGGLALSIPLSPDRTLEIAPKTTTYTATISAPEPARPDDLPDELVDQLSGDDDVEDIDWGYDDEEESGEMAS
ncbi:toll/interleukin-1 receptor domain-containing protein [Burkholderia pseudomallei]|uniref:toll/interleukin-1 receptor domain-containing protein n=1 Tax=Burkholderia pseudomallei TaxID=28450 RepID=UPI0022D6E805|nr:toll/interleukin-1 receptor domain-containing protein [Burkholderia pseudomallei]MDA0558318.1 toll/interleukin-1 receptor domain-containing protein [Burkholderia pseudomallei]